MLNAEGAMRKSGKAIAKQWQSGCCAAAK